MSALLQQATMTLLQQDMSALFQHVVSDLLQFPIKNWSVNNYQINKNNKLTYSVKLLICDNKLTY